MPGGEAEKPYLHRPTMAVKIVSDYTGLNFNEAVELDCMTFQMLLRDGFIHKMAQSEAGQKYLEECWIMTQTEPDMAGLDGIWGIKHDNEEVNTC